MNEPKKKVGRPQAEIDLEQVERLAAIDCTEPEIAAVLGIDYATWKRHKKRNPDIVEIVERGKENGKASLRRLQWKTASEGNPTMQIWLGKQRLGQQDKKHIEQQQLEPLVIVTDKSDTSADEGLSQSESVSGSGGGETVRKNLPRTH
jgi:hypothetical protein